MNLSANISAAAQEEESMTFEEARDEVLAFRDDRDWAQFHNPKDLAISICLEASELLENFQWSGTDLAAKDKDVQIKEELADVLIYCIDMANCLDVNIADIISDKIKSDIEKYPVAKAKGNTRKYTQL